MAGSSPMSTSKRHVRERGDHSAGVWVAYTRFPFKHLEAVRQLEREAKRGVWGP
jgi:CRISPR/Cas system-associated protein Cas10 (large subunit of type III CRISPR-Cas system)